MTLRRISPLGLLMAGLFTSTNAQPRNTPTSILLDVLSFHGPDVTDKEYVDVYVGVPYQGIQFQEYDGRYAAQLTATITLRDSVGYKAADTTLTRSKLEDSYEVTQGSLGTTENFAIRFLVPRGKYRVEVNIKDVFARRDRTASDTIVVPDFRNTPCFSSLMSVSQIEETNGRYTITPYIGNTLWNQDQTLFTFFEYYTTDLPGTIAFSWQLSSVDGRRLTGGLGSPVKIIKRTTQQFLPIRQPERVAAGSYTLAVYSHPVTNNLIDTSVVHATGTRTYRIPKTLGGSVMSDLTGAIKQLAYVATQAEIDAMMAASDNGDRLTLFEDFWKQQDPTPRTVRNEAFEDYYARVNTANKLYKSYADGWMTDMGRVYIVCGEPSSKERVPSQYGSTQLERWYYPNKQAFVFEDTGFGDYRLRSPWPPGFKYHYQ